MEFGLPQEILPSIGTVENPSVLYDGRHLLICYDVAPIDCGGNAVLLFSDVIYFARNSNKLSKGGGRYQRYPARAWQFTEVFGSDRTERWKALKPHFWTISFNDVTIEVVFREVRLLHRNSEAILPQVALMDYLGTLYNSKLIGC